LSRETATLTLQSHKWEGACLFVYLCFCLSVCLCVCMCVCVCVCVCVCCGWMFWWVCVCVCSCVMFGCVFLLCTESALDDLDLNDFGVSALEKSLEGSSALP